MNLRPTFRLSTLLLGIALVASGLTAWRWHLVLHWNSQVDQFANFATKYHQPKSEADILVNLMRQNPRHSLWKEFEYAPIFQGDRLGLLGGFHISWPQQTIQLGKEFVHVLTSQHPCNSRKLVVHTDAASRILDVQVVHGIAMNEPLELAITSLHPQPVIRLGCSKRYDTNAAPIVHDLTLAKSSAHGSEPATIKIINRQPE